MISATALFTTGGLCVSPAVPSARHAASKTYAATGNSSRERSAMSHDE